MGLGNQRTRHPKIKLLVALALTTIGLNQTMEVGSIVLTTPVIEAKAETKSKKNQSSNNKNGKEKDQADSESDDDDSDKDADQDSSSGSSSKESDWNSALSTLSEGAVGAAYGAKDTKKPTSGSSNTQDSQMSVDQAIGSGSAANYLNAWGYLGNGNTDVWIKNNNSSSTVSYDALVSGASGSDVSNPVRNAYKQSARFAYAMRASGLDQPEKTGFSSNNVITQGVGWILQISNSVLHSAKFLTQWAFKLATAINPINWMFYAKAAAPVSFTKLAKYMRKMYQAFLNIGKIWIIATLVGGLALAALGITVGVNGGKRSQGAAFSNAFVTFLKRSFMVVIMPVLTLSIMSMITSFGSSLFETQKSDVSNYATYGAFVDYNSWVMRSRLALPSNVKLPTTFDSKKLPSMSHNDILSINLNGAGITDLKGMVNSTTNSRAAFENSSTRTNTKLNSQSASLLKSWNNDTVITAADYASAANPEIERKAVGAKDSKSTDTKTVDIKGELVKGRYNTNSMNAVHGKSNSGYISGNATASSTAGNGSTGINGTAPGGLSTLGMYSYLLTTANDAKMTTADTEKLQNDVAEPTHQSTVLVGTGIESLGNMIWALGLAAGLTLVVVGYAFELMKSILVSQIGSFIPMLRAALTSLSGGMQLLGIAVGFFISVLGTALMYTFSQYMFKAVAMMSDTILDNHYVNAGILLLGSNGNTTVGQLASSAQSSTSHGIVNMLFGAFLIGLALLLLRYCGVTISQATQGVQDLTNQILASFGNAFGSGSGGVNNAFMQNANTENTVGNASRNILASNSSHLMAAGAGLSAAGLTGKGHGSKAAHTNSNNSQNKQNTQAQNLRDRSSSSLNKQGNAANRTTPLSKNISQGNNLANNALKNAQPVNNGLDAGTRANSVNTPQNMSLNNPQSQVENSNGLEQPTNSADNSQYNHMTTTNPSENEQQIEQLSDALNNPSSADANTDNPLTNSQSVSSSPEQQALGLGIGTPNSAATQAGLMQSSPVDQNMLPGKVQSMMSDVKDANSKAQNAAALVSNNPTNQTLANRATTAASELGNAQQAAMNAYNGQGLNNDLPQADWLSDQTSPETMSVGSANGAMNGVYDAQSSLEDAVSQYGENSSQALSGQQQLKTAQDNAVKAGMNPNIVMDPNAVEQAHDTIQKEVTSINSGTWKPQGRSAAKGIQASSRTLGI